MTWDVSCVAKIGRWYVRNLRPRMAEYLRIITDCEVTLDGIKGYVEVTEIAQLSSRV